MTEPLSFHAVWGFRLWGIKCRDRYLCHVTGNARIRGWSVCLRLEGNLVHGLMTKSLPHLYCQLLTKYLVDSGTVEQLMRYETVNEDVVRPDYAVK